MKKHIDEALELYVDQPMSVFTDKLEAYITKTAAGTIDADYINSRFVRFVKYLYTEGKDSGKVKEMQLQLHHVFATLSQRD